MDTALSMDSQKPAHLEPSELGTREYWDQTYSTDLTTHASTPSHEGHTWFSDVNASQKILKYLTSNSLGLDKEATTFLDLGTGNGEMLFLLREEGGFTNRLIGVDYSRSSVELCKELVQQKGLALGPSLDGHSSIDFTLWDILHSKPRPEWVEGFDVVLDKGTFDAVSLSGEVDELQRRVVEGYARRVEGLVKKGGLVVVTSCNWTEEELKTWFCGEESTLEVSGRVNYPVFKFGGHTGQSVCSICFKKKSLPRYVECHLCVPEHCKKCPSARKLPPERTNMAGNLSAWVVLIHVDLISA